RGHVEFGHPGARQGVPRRSQRSPPGPADRHPCAVTGRRLERLRPAGKIAAERRSSKGAPSVAQFIYVLARARKAHGDKVVLDHVTLNFLPGAKIGVVGPNGAGKSSLLRIMAGADVPSNGEARLMPGYTVGMLAQEPKLDDSKTVLENIELAVADT